MLPLNVISRRLTSFVYIISYIHTGFVLVCESEHLFAPFFILYCLNSGRLEVEIYRQFLLLCLSPKLGSLRKFGCFGHFVFCVTRFDDCFYFVVSSGKKKSTSVGSLLKQQPNGTATPSPSQLNATTTVRPTRSKCGQTCIKMLPSFFFFYTITTQRKKFRSLQMLIAKIAKSTM